MPPDGPILVAGAGIAGLCAALAFAQRGFPVEVCERAARLEEAGAGIQLSPNATRILFALGLRDALLAVAPRPDAVRLIDAKSLRGRAQVPLGAWGETRWRAPYLTCRRADLQRVLLEAVEADSRIELRLGAAVAGAGFSDDESVRLALGGNTPGTTSGAFLVGADGVHSASRGSLLKQSHGSGVVPPLRSASRSTSLPSGGRGSAVPLASLAPFLSLRRGERWIDPEQRRGARRSGGPTRSQSAGLPEPSEPKTAGLTAWRSVISQGALPSAPDILHPRNVSAFLKPEAHLVAYPTGGETFNLVAFAATRGEPGSTGDADAFRAAFADAAPALRQLVNGAEWGAWPLLTVPEETPWTFGSRAALIGDAAHAMTPFAAQGAAMAIEDAFTLAAAYAAPGLPVGERLSRWEGERRARIERVRRRGRLNRLTWHAGGPLALARNLVLRLLPAEKLARDLDWLYGWRPG